MLTSESTSNGLINGTLRVFARFCLVFEIGFRIVVSNNENLDSCMQILLNPLRSLDCFYA